MKKVILRIFVIVLIAALLSSTLLLFSCKKKKKTQESDYGKYVTDGEKDISIGVLADIHVMSETQAVNMTCSDYKAWEAHGQKMLGLSESILKTAVDRIIAESDFDVVLVSGDNADDGGEVTHRAVANELKRLENAGIKVYTIPGNHDINNKSYTYAGGKATLTNPTTEKEFAEIYADFGYNSADTLEFYKNSGTDSAANAAGFQIGGNLSYVADLSDKYRLIAIDMCKCEADYYLTDPDGTYAAAGYAVDSEGYVLVDGERYPLVSGRHDGGMTSSILSWAEQKTREAVAAGKIPVGMMHFPLIQHFGSLVQAENSAVNDPEGRHVADVLADAGMKFIFTGHIHIQDNAMYTSKNGKKILDINSASLCNYPTPVRYFRAKGTDAYVRTWNMNCVKEQYLPSYLSAAEKSAILKDFKSYSVNYLDDSMLAKVKNKVDMDMIYKLLSKLGVKKDGTNDAAVTSFANSVYNDVFLRFLKLPLYEKNANGGLSVEGAAKAYGVSIPSSGYIDVFNLAMSFVAGLYGGEESCAANDSRVTLLKYSIYTALKIIDDFDFFAKVKTLNPSFATIDIGGALSDLYKYGTLDVCADNLLVGLLSSLDIKALKRYSNPNANPYTMLSTMASLVGDLDILPEGLDVAPYIVAIPAQQKGFVRLGALLDDYIASKLLVGLTNDSVEGGSTYVYLDGVTDSAPNDNRLKINMTTMAYSALK